MKRAFLMTILWAGVSAAASLVSLPLLALAAPSSQAEWEQVLEAARREGEVSVLGPPGVARDALTLPFQKAYGIRVGYFGAGGSEQASRVAMERRAGKYIWDLFVGGTTTGLTSLIPIGAFDPLEPALILPDVKDPKNWSGGGLEFVDPNRQMVVMTPTHRVIFVVNSALVDPKAFRSYKDLLDSKWKGQIVMDDPRSSGPGQATFTFFYLHPELGPNFIRALARQDPMVIRDSAQAINMVGQGKYPVLIGPRDSVLADALRRDVPISIVNPTQVREGSDISSGGGNAALFNRGPHPNAAKVYVNWLLSKEGQYNYARALGYVSRRLDVPNDYAEPWRAPQPGAIKTYTREAMEAKEPLTRLLNEVLRR